MQIAVLRRVGRGCTRRKMTGAQYAEAICDRGVEPWGVVAAQVSAPNMGLSAVR